MESDLTANSVDAESAFQLLFLSCDTKAAISGLPSSDLDDKELLLKDAAEDSLPVDAVCIAPAPHQPIAQVFTALPLPLPTSRLPSASVKPTDQSKSSVESIGAVNMRDPNQGVPSLPVAAAGLAPTPAEPRLNIKNPAPVDAVNIAHFDIDAKAPVLQEMDPSPNVAFAAVDDLAPATPLPVLEVEQKSPRIADRPMQHLQTAVALPSGVQVTVDEVKSAPPFSTAENTWRQKWTGAAIPADLGDEKTASLMMDPAEGEVPIPKTVPATLGTALPLSGPKAQNFMPLAPPDGLAIIVPSPLTKLAEPVVLSEKAPGIVGPVIFAIERATKSTEPNSTTDATLDQPEIGALLVTPKHMIHSAFAPSPAPSMPNLSGAIASHIVSMSKTQDNGPVELSLSPNELGKLTISIKQEGNFVHVTLTADRPETLDLMRRNASDLVADLRQTGFSGASLSFGQGQKDQNPSYQHAEPVNKNHQSSLSLLPETKPTAPGRSQNGAGVDLRF